MKKILLILALIMHTVTYAQNDFSDAQKLEGQYHHVFYDLKTLYLGQLGNHHVMAASTAVFMNACSGTARGIGVFKDKRLVFSPLLDEKLNQDDNCVFTITFSNDYKSAEINSTGCYRYSGASCGWEGGHSLVKE